MGTSPNIVALRKSLREVSWSQMTLKMWKSNVCGSPILTAEEGIQEVLEKDSGGNLDVQGLLHH